MRARRWSLRPTIPADARQELKDYPLLSAQLLHNRGIRAAGEALAFLRPGEELLGDPFLLPEMEVAVARLKRAVAQKETTAIFGDFDVDGISGTALLANGLQALGLRAIPYIPHRDEGHGLNLKALALLKEQGASLLITVDCGISDAPMVEEARRLGLDVIITDHHAPPAILPHACAVVDPRLSSSRYPFEHLTGAGMALKLLQALSQHLGHGLDPSLLELAALGTLADVAPLEKENRYLVYHGLKSLNSTSNLGLRALIAQAGLKPGYIDTEAVHFGLAPRLNAAGRLEHADLSLRLLTTHSPEEASALAQKLEETNRERQRLTKDQVARAQEKVSLWAPAPPIIIVEDQEFSTGIIGLIAGQLTEEYYRPAVAIALTTHTARGSARSIPEFNIVEAFRICADLFTRYGGHAQAAGFEMPSDPDRIEELKARLQAIAAERLDVDQLQPTLDIDAQMSLAALQGETYAFLRSLAPFGPGNSEPLFLSRGVQLVDKREIGADGQHLRLKLQEGKVTWDAIAFNPSTKLKAGWGRLDLVYTLGVNAWGGAETLQLRVVDFAPS